MARDLRALAGVVAIGLAALGTRGAQAEPSSASEASATPGVLAEVLFQDARALLAKGKTHEACAKFHESQRLDPSGGTLLNLALCDIDDGRTATGWGELHEALADARRDGRRDREDIAVAKLAEIEPRLRHVRVDVRRPETRGLTLTLDGTNLGRATWGVAMPIDPGPHVVRAVAPGAEAFIADVAPPDEGATTIVTVEELRSAGASPASKMHRSARRIAGTALLGLGAAAVTVGSIAGAFAIHKRHESDALCRFGRCSAEGVAENDQAQLAGNASTGAFIGAGVSIGVGLTLLLTALEPSDRAARVGSGPSCAEGARWCAGTTILVPF